MGVSVQGVHEKCILVSVGFIRFTENLDLGLIVYWGLSEGQILLLEPRIAY